jgi:aryl-alcohol dehydrogenase-like predicted oxidoreductase
MQRFDWPVAFAKLKEQGKIRFPGVSILDAASARWLIAQGLADVMQVEYSIVTPEVGREVFPLALTAGVGTIVRMPMAQGILTGKFRPGEPVPAGHRALRAEERMPVLIERAEAIRPIAQKAGLPMDQLALRYAIAPEGVSAAIPGARSVEQLERNVAASTGNRLPGAIIEEIEQVQHSWQD